MDSQLTQALVGLGVAVVGSLGTLVTVITHRLSQQNRNTQQLAAEARDAATEQHGRDLAELARRRNQVTGLRYLLRERDERLAYILARHPEVQATLDEYAKRNSVDYTAAEEDAVIKRMLRITPGGNNA